MKRGRVSGTLNEAHNWVPSFLNQIIEEKSFGSLSKAIDRQLDIIINMTYLLS